MIDTTDPDVLVDLVRGHIEGGALVQWADTLKLLQGVEPWTLGIVLDKLRRLDDPKGFYRALTTKFESAALLKE